jgi:glutamate transport system substrate-binding protein
MVEKVNTALKAYIDDGSWKAALEQTVRPSGYKIPKAPTPGS